MSSRIAISFLRILTPAPVFGKLIMINSWPWINKTHNYPHYELPMRPILSLWTNWSAPMSTTTRSVLDMMASLEPSMGFDLAGFLAYL